MADTVTIEVNTIKAFIQDLCNAQTGYDTNYLHRSTIFKGIRTSADDTSHDILIHKETDTASTYVTQISDIVDENSNVYEITIFIETCEQFLRIMNYNFSPTTRWTSDNPANSIKGIQLTVKIQNNLYFQNDSLYKNGIYRELRLRFTNNLNNSTCWMKVEPENILEDVIIQGLQITATRFFWFYSESSVQDRHKLLFNYIYFKDCVYTKEEDDVTTYGTAPSSIKLPICTAQSTSSDSTQKMFFTSCKISMHIRVSEHGYYFSSTNIKFDTCSLYIEYSDLYNNDCPAFKYDSISLYNGEYLNCSVIVRNLAIKILRANNSGGASAYRRFLGSGDSNRRAKNCAWDIEIYSYYIKNTGGTDTNDAFYGTWVSQSGQSQTYTFDYLPTVYMENNFLSIKVKSLRIRDYYYTEDSSGTYYKQAYGYSTSHSTGAPDYSTQKYSRTGEIYDITYGPGDTFNKPVFTLGYNNSYVGSYGVNVFNMGDDSNDWVKFSYTDPQDGGHYTSAARWHPNVKLLSETDCKNPSVLNKWGFFVNQDYIYRPLTTAPVSWSTNYWLYFYFDEDLRVYKNIPKGVAPEFVANRYYEKIARS